ncbi:enolase C-terminal domain-like protein [Streptomyces sp. NPDC047108]|uniref:mandelate racemase/muconate lactonizing enzyme family protein n=1 Tax=Streptomyces sp. NPDC047108 TaxID=3155025 RepID=UPI0033C96DCF
MRMTHYRIEAALSEPFAGTRGVTDAVRQSVVRLRWDGLEGYGTALGAAPAELDRCMRLLVGADPYRFVQTLDRLEAAGVRPAVTAAVDMALHDLLGKRAGLPLHRMLGLQGLPLPPTALSIGVCSDDELARRGEKLADWPILKLKLTPEDDGSRAGVLRDVYDGRIWVDGNGSWTPERAVEVAHELHRHDVELLEQPVAPDPDPAGLRHVHEHAPLLVVADEDCQGPADVLRLRDCAAAVNIKLTKCGGLRRAMEMIALAQHAGLKVMLGCKTESTLGVSAMAQLAQLADFLDLDGHLDLLADPFTGIGVDRGTITVPDGPGLGATPTDTREGLLI